MKSKRSIWLRPFSTGVWIAKTGRVDFGSKRNLKTLMFNFENEIDPISKLRDEKIG
jgi:hypothetical protein